MYSEWRDTFSVHGKVEAAVGNVLVETQQASFILTATAEEQKDSF